LKCTCGHSVQQNSQVDYPCIQLQAYRIDSILPQSRYFQSKSQDIVQTAFNSNVWQTESAFSKSEFYYFVALHKRTTKITDGKRNWNSSVGKYCSSISPAVLSQIAFTRDPGMISTHTDIHRNPANSGNETREEGLHNFLRKHRIVQFIYNTWNCNKSTVSPKYFLPDYC